MRRRTHHIKTNGPLKRAVALQQQTLWVDVMFAEIKCMPPSARGCSVFLFDNTALKCRHAVIHLDCMNFIKLMAAKTLKIQTASTANDVVYSCHRQASIEI